MLKALKVTRPVGEKTHVRDRKNRQFRAGIYRRVNHLISLVPIFVLPTATFGYFSCFPANMTDTMRTSFDC